MHAGAHTRREQSSLDWPKPRRMHCPHCSRPLWRPFAEALYAPKAEGIAGTCSGCAHAVAVKLPAYLSATEYTAFGGCVAGFSLAGLLAIDVDPGLRVQLVASAVALFVSMVALLTWTGARVE